MDSHPATIKSLEVILNSRKQYTRNTNSSYGIELNPMQSENNLHCSSASAIPFTNQRSECKELFDLEEIKKEIKGVQYRRLEREKEIEEICQFDMSEETPCIKGKAETTTTMPTPRKEEVENNAGYWVCCKKYCLIM